MATRKDGYARNARGKADGRYTRNINTAERDAEAARLRSQGLTYPEIAERLGWRHKGDAHNAVTRALKAVVREPAEQLIAIELDRLDTRERKLNDLEEKVQGILERKHVTVSHGRVVKLDDGEPIEDDVIALQAGDRLLKIDAARDRIAERRAAITGINAPTRVSVDATKLGEEITTLLDALTAGRVDDSAGA